MFLTLYQTLSFPLFFPIITIVQELLTQTKGWIGIRFSVYVCMLGFLFKFLIKPTCLISHRCHVGGSTASQVTMGTHCEEQWYLHFPQCTFFLKFRMNSVSQVETDGSCSFILNVKTYAWTTLCQVMDVICSNRWIRLERATLITLSN